MIRFTIEDAHAMVIALDGHCEMPNETLSDFVKSRIEGYHHRQFSPIPELPNIYPMISDGALRDVMEMSDNDAEQLLHRISVALAYQQAFPDRSPIYALRSAELISVGDYPPIFVPSKENSDESN